MINYILCFGVVSTSILIVKNLDKIKKIYTALTLFSENNIVENFRSIRSLGGPYRTAIHGNEAKFENAEIKYLPSTFIFKDKEYNLEKWLKLHWTTGLVVLKIEDVTKAKLVYEEYFLGNTFQTKTISWSINKSVTSALIGIAIGEEKIKSVDDYVTDYVPSLKNSGYCQVKLKDALQMTSGISFDEDYSKPFSDINCMSYSLALGYNIDNCIASLRQQTRPGTKHNYVSSDTQVLAMVLKSVIGEQSLTSYLEEKLWKLGGFEADCDWLIDNEENQRELAFGTLNASTRDYARFGWLYLNKGLSPLDGKRLIDAKWIKDSITCVDQDLLSEQHQKCGAGYGYQWWIPKSKRNDYLAIGVYGQFIYIDPKNNIVISKNSADPNYNSYVDEHGVNVMELEAFEAFRAISDHYAK